MLAEGFGRPSNSTLIVVKPFAVGPIGHWADVQALLRLSPGRNILGGYSNLLRLLEQPFPQER